MSIAIWSEIYVTGHPMVDKQHQELFRMVNQLHDAIITGKSKEVLMPTLDKLAHYTAKHFTDEEALMAAAEYPQMATHKLKHLDLANQAKEIIEGYRSGKTVLSITLSNFLAEWLRHHINGDDKALVAYLNARKMKKSAA